MLYIIISSVLWRMSEAELGRAEKACMGLKTMMTMYFYRVFMYRKIMHIHVYDYCSCKSMYIFTDWNFSISVYTRPFKDSLKILWIFDLKLNWNYSFNNNY